MRILIIDDDEIMRLVAGRWLSCHEIVFASGLDEARARLGLESEKLDLIMCDVHIPPYDPGEVASEIESIAKGIPVVRISVNSDMGVDKTLKAIRQCVAEYESVASQRLHHKIKATENVIRELVESLRESRKCRNGAV